MFPTVLLMAFVVDTVLRPSDWTQNGAWRVGVDWCSKRFWKPEDGRRHRPSGFPVWGNLAIGVGSTNPHRLFDFVFAFVRHAASNSAGVT